MSEACCRAMVIWSAQRQRFIERQKIDDQRTVQPRRNRIRMVVVSGQVRHHPVWDVVLRGIIAHMDRRQFEILLYHTGSLVDEETDWARSRVDRFVQGPKSTEAWLNEVAQDRPDVMFYPEVGMDPATCALAALKLAPLQVAGWGHPVTTGLPSMNLFLSGELLGRAGSRTTLSRNADSIARHRRVHGIRPRSKRSIGTVRIGSGMSCASHCVSSPSSSILRTMCCWRALPRMPARASSGWLRPTPILGRPPGCAIGWRPPSALKGSIRRLTCRVTPWLPRQQFAGFLDEMDIYLDCPAFSGYTTAWSAIHRGLPIVTWEGEFLRQRLACRTTAADRDHRWNRARHAMSM